MESPPERQPYHASCHCQAVKFTVIPAEPIATIFACNCSMCSRVSTRFVRYNEGDVKFERGENTLVEYRFGTETSPCQFCPKCGTIVLFQTAHFKAVNVRAIHEFDLPAYPLHTYNGAAKLPAYLPHAHNGPLPSIAEGEKVYTGSCHCGNITVALAAEDVRKMMIVECDCSICLRNGHRSVYVDPSKAVIHTADPSKQISYEFGRKRMTRITCGHCGVYVGGTIKPVPPEVLASIEPEKAKMALLFANKHAINLNVVDGVELDKMNVVKLSTRPMEPHYVVT